MRHLHFTQSLEPLNGGGLGSSTVALHRQMRSAGLPSVLCSTHGGTPQNSDEDIFEFPRIKPSALYFSPAMQRQAPKLVRDAEVLHGHGLYVGPNYIFGRESRRQSKPLVYHVHGMFEPYILNRSRWKKRLVHWVFENRNFRRVSLWRALTSTEADQIRACGIKQPIVVAPNGLDLAAFSTPEEIPSAINTPLVPALLKRGLRLLFLGRIHPKKGLGMLLPAWAKLKLMAKDWQLVVAGPDEQGHLGEVQELATKLGLGERIAFTGAVTGTTKLSLLRSADLFVLPSYSEGFPMSILEALASEVPVIATRTCNFPDISTAQAGWECDATLEQISMALGEGLRASESERNERGQNGRRLVEKSYSWASIVAKLDQACGCHCG